MKFTVGEIYTIKMTSGEEAVVKILDERPQEIDVGDPLSVAPGPQGMGLVPSLFTADHSKPITINTNTIMARALTDESVRVKYIEATTGLRVPAKKILVE
jgi:hypothetical protein